MLPSGKIKIVLADDHVLVRSGMVLLLRELAQDTCVYEAADFPAALALIGTHPDCDLALIDLNMPGMNGFEALDQIAQQAPTVPVVILSGSENAEDMRRVLDHGAMGYIPKSESAPVILNALRLVLAGGVYVPPVLVRNQRSAAVNNTPGTPLLTPRQLDVLAHVIEGMSNKAIARALGLSEATVKAHVGSIFKTLNVSNRTQAARVAESCGLALPALRR
jgi:two-component system, NarL family, nitrate/nitrite response regulator NarL